jgi:hypothetical protein
MVHNPAGFVVEAEGLRAALEVHELAPKLAALHL